MIPWIQSVLNDPIRRSVPCYWLCCSPHRCLFSHPLLRMQIKTSLERQLRSGPRRILAFAVLRGSVSLHSQPGILGERVGVYRWYGGRAQQQSLAPDRAP